MSRSAIHDDVDINSEKKKRKIKTGEVLHHRTYLLVEIKFNRLLRWRQLSLTGRFISEWTKHAHTHHPQPPPS